MALTKPAGSWAYPDLAALPDDRTRYEIIDGELFEMPSPTLAHAMTIAALVDLLLPVLKRLGGRWLTAPLDVFFPGADPVQPDLVVLLPGSRVRLVRRGIEGPPDLLIEVLSPSNRAHDQVRKRQLYARGGVREYWIVDPEQRVIEVVNGRGVTVQRVDAGSEPVLRSPLLGELAVALDEVVPGVDDLPA
ncbi:MAG: Uma2 family endonuclease [Chloroflexota bacterium]|nr:Uma2 family endonuclease [Chloroflexota bacterium]